MAGIAQQATAAITNAAEAAKGAFAGAVATPLKQGVKIPGTALKENNPQEASVTLSTIGGKIVIVGVPGAFTPPCSSQVPGYVENESKFTEKGVNGIYVVAVNDSFVTQAWKEKLGAKDSKVHFLADDTGAWTAAAGLSINATGLLGGLRSNRYAAIVQDGVVQKIFIEDEVPEVTVTAADKVLANL